MVYCPSTSEHLSTTLTPDAIRLLLPTASAAVQQAAPAVYLHVYAPPASAAVPATTAAAAPAPPSTGAGSASGSASASASASAGAGAGAGEAGTSSHRDFYEWCLQRMMKQLETALYVPLPDDVVQSAKQELSSGDAAFLEKVCVRVCVRVCVCACVCVVSRLLLRRLSSPVPVPQWHHYSAAFFRPLTISTS
jgi:hypothetical protein